MRPSSLNLRLLPILLILSILLFVLDSIELLDPIKYVAQSASLPFQQAMADTVGLTHRLRVNILNMWWAQKQLNALSIQYNQALAGQAKAALLEEENKRLQLQLGNPVTKNHRLVEAKIIARYPDMILDRGRADHLEPGMAVVIGDILIGYLDKVEPKTSKLKLPLDSESKIMVITSETKHKGILSGSFGSGMRLTKILQGSALTANQLVLTTGEETNLPPGLSVGKITEVFGKQSDLFQEADVIPLIKLGDLEAVFVIIE